MSSPVDELEFSDQIVLHLDVAPEQTADAEVVAQALLAWIDAARAASGVLDPFAELKIGLVSVEPGSVQLRALFQFVEDRLIAPVADALTPYPRIKRYARQLAIATSIGIPTGLTIVVGEHVLYPEPPAAVHPIVREEFEADQRKIGEDLAVQKKVQQFYRVVERDKALTGVSVRDGSTMKPIVAVPKSEFADRSGLWSQQEPDAPTRPQSAIWDVVVTHPALFSKPKAWKFRRDGLPFSAMMTDEQFLNAMREGTLPLHIQEGVQMRVKVEWTERLNGQEWEPITRSRKITKVISPKPDPLPAPLLREQ
jgi:hypothetical protein